MHNWPVGLMRVKEVLQKFSTSFQKTAFVMIYNFLVIFKNHDGLNFIQDQVTDSSSKDWNNKFEFDRNMKNERSKWRRLGMHRLSYIIKQNYTFIFFTFILSKFFSSNHMEKFSFEPIIERNCEVKRKYMKMFNL